MKKQDAIKTAMEIIVMEDFKLKIIAVTDEITQTEEGCGFNVGDRVFQLEDLQGGNLGNIEAECFDNLSQVIDRLENYHHDYFDEDEEDDKDTFEFLRNDEAIELLMTATPADVEGMLA